MNTYYIENEKHVNRELELSELLNKLEKDFPGITKDTTDILFKKEKTNLSNIIDKDNSEF